MYPLSTTVVLLTVLLLCVNLTPAFSGTGPSKCYCSSMFGLLLSYSNGSLLYGPVVDSSTERSNTSLGTTTSGKLFHQHSPSFQQPTNLQRNWLRRATRSHYAYGVFGLTTLPHACFAGSAPTPRREQTGVFHLHEHDHRAYPVARTEHVDCTRTPAVRMSRILQCRVHCDTFSHDVSRFCNRRLVRGSESLPGPE